MNSVLHDAHENLYQTFTMGMDSICFVFVEYINLLYLTLNMNSKIYQSYAEVFYA